MNVPQPLPVESERIGPIDRMDLITVRLPFVEAFGTSVQVWTHKEALLFRIESEGETAWSECVADPDPFYLSETTETVRHIIKDFLLPLVEPGATLGETLRQFRHVRGHGMAKATVENGLLVLLSRKKGVPLHEALGFPRRRIRSGISIGLQDTPEKLLARVDQAAVSGYHRVKLKIKKGKDVEWVGRVRERLPEFPMMVDANGDYTLEDADHLRQLDAFGLMMIEQPLGYSDIYQHSLLQRQIHTPLCLDESLLTFDDVVSALDLGACRVINIKQGRVGGLLEAIRIAQYAASRGIGVWSGGMDETGIGRALNIHLQTVDAFDLPGDTSETRNYFAEDIVTPSVVLEKDGFIEVPEGPGLGVEVLPERVMKYAIRWERIR